MNKVYLILIFVLWWNVSFSSNYIIYIDLSDNSINRDNIISQTKQIINSNNTENFIVFISNGVNPIIINDYVKLDKALNELLYMSNPSSPDMNYDIDTLNSLMNRKSFINNKLEPKELIKLYFFIIPNSKNEIFIQRFLLSNRLTSKMGAYEKS